MIAVARFVSGRLTAWITLAGGILVVGALFALLPKAGAASAPTAGLPGSSQAAQVTALLERFPGADRTAAVLVWSRASGLTQEDRGAVAARARVLAQRSIAPQAVRPAFSEDGAVALAVVPLPAAKAERDAEGLATSLRSAAREDLPDGLTARLTGPVGFQADIADSFAGADLRLLLVTVVVVALLLIVTYRSPVLWIVPLLVVGAADGLARIVVGALAGVWGITIDASVAGIQSVLVFGAGTNYALLLIARYREELVLGPAAGRGPAASRSGGVGLDVGGPDRHDAMRTAVRAAGPTIAASGGTVALSLLTLLLGELAGSRALGLACAVGVVIAILFAVLLLPAALVVFGRGLFWPFVPRHRPEEPVRRLGIWERIGHAVARRPRRVAAAAVLLLGAMGAGLVGFRFGLSQTEQLLGEPESVRAQALLDRSFPAGTTAQTIVLAPSAEAEQAATVARGVDGVTSVRPGPTAVGRAELDLVLDAPPASDAAFTILRELRSAYAEQDGALARTLVGGTDAIALDQRDAALRDQRLVIPAILAIVLVILGLLLRSLVAPALLLASVLATYGASLGLGNLLFTRVFGFPAFDVPVPLYAFLFLVALGVDYNIFLTARAREERAAHGTREGMIMALGATGGVITSAGVLLAAVFAVLGVLPVVALAQIGTLVGIGVLLDTLLVRTVLVPALVFLLGDRFWWPSRRPAAPVPAAPARGEREEGHLVVTP